MAQTITIALDGSRRRDIKLYAGDDLTLNVVVYTLDADTAPATVTNLVLTPTPSDLITVPVGTAFTVSDEAPGRFWYSIKGDIGGLTTTLCYGILEIWGEGVFPSGTDYDFWGNRGSYP